MAYTLRELSPLLPFIRFPGYDMEFKMVTLNTQNKFEVLYGSTAGAMDSITKDADEIYKLGWLLVKDEFGSFKEWKDYGIDVIGTAKFAQELTRVFHESIVLSMPLIKNKKLHDEYLSAIGQDTKKTCYGAYYDSIAQRYGYKIADFMELTLRQLHILLGVSQDSRYDEFEVQAALAGKQIKARMKMVDIDVEEDEQQDKAAQEMLARQKEIYEQGKK